MLGVSVEWLLGAHEPERDVFVATVLATGLQTTRELSETLGPREFAAWTNSICFLLTEAVAEKRRLYGRCFSVLRSGGWFFNIDEMSTLWDDAYRDTLYDWVRYVERTRHEVPANLAHDCQAWCDPFDQWKVRNIDGAGAPKIRGDDIHELFVDQLHWLRGCGFVNVDLFFKHRLWSIIGGRKPGESEARKKCKKG